MHHQREPVAQWTLDVTVFHCPDFGHRIEARTLDRRGGWKECGHWDWRHFGVDREMVREIEATIGAVISEHLYTRYGVQEELFTRWAGDSGAQ